MKQDKHIGQMGLFKPEVDSWTRPDFLPNWLNRPVISLDLETRDDGLNSEKGPGWAFGPRSGFGGHIAGFSACDGKKSFYFPMRHPDSDNFPIEECHRWLKSHLERAGGETVFHNASYDLGWLLRELGEFVPTKVGDTMMGACILDENRLSYSLDALSKARGLEGKNKKVLHEAARALGYHPMKDLWQLPARFVGAYAEDDATLTYLLNDFHTPELEAQDLVRAYRLEADLAIVCVKMRMRGINIDENQVEYLTAKMRQLLSDQFRSMKSDLAIGRSPDVKDIWSGKTLKSWFDNHGVDYPGKGTEDYHFESEWLLEQSHWLPLSVGMARRYSMAESKFLTDYIKNSTIDGKIHAEIHQLRGEEKIPGSRIKGTVTYRFSYSNPPLQQITANDEELGAIIRTCFLPDEGKKWLVADLNQQEPRMTVHYAILLQCRGWEQARDYYTNNPKADYHQFVSDLTKIPRPRAKIINLSLAYGMGVTELCNRLGLTKEQGEPILHDYHKALPFVRALTNVCSNKAGQHGFLRLIGGARCRFPLWQNAREFRGDILPHDKAVERWQNNGIPIKRAGTFKALNRLIQGSSARQIKQCTLDCYNAGYLPMLQLHDDLSFSTDHPERDGLAIREIMCNAIKLNVPMLCDIEVGDTWGSVSKILTGDK